MFQRQTQHPTAAREGGRPGRLGQLLIESRDPSLALSDFGAYRDAGFEVTLCSGPVAEASECPLMAGEPCPLAAAADVVLFDLGNQAERVEVLAAMRATRPDLPIVVRSAEPPADDLGVPTITPTTSIAGQLNTLRGAVLAAERGTR